MLPMKIPLGSIRLDGGTQFRSKLDPVIVGKYASLIREVSPFPSIVVFYDGKDYWLADGFYRCAAHEQAGQKEIIANIRLGSLRDAVLFAATRRTSTDGVRFTREEKRRRVRALLADAEWSTWSDAKISRKCGVPRPLVASLRGEVNDPIQALRVMFTAPHAPEDSQHDEHPPEEQEDVGEHDDEISQQLANDARIEKKLAAIKGLIMDFLEVETAYAGRLSQFIMGISRVVNIETKKRGQL